MPIPGVPAWLSTCDKNETSLQEVQTGAPHTKIKNFNHSGLQNNKGQYLEAIDKTCISDTSMTKTFTMHINSLLPHLII
jgi:hypothetical protein